jgi:hypothetical protein
MRTLSFKPFSRIRIFSRIRSFAGILTLSYNSIYSRSLFIAILFTGLMPRAHSQNTASDKYDRKIVRRYFRQ